MQQITEQIFLFGNDDVIWPFDNNPHYALRTKNSPYPHREFIDTFPCYHHNLDIVKKILEDIQVKFPIGFKPMVCVLTHEGKSRTNGCAIRNTIYSSDDEYKPFDPIICLWGKRIPIHPAMTRYLMGHEYGHQIDNWINYSKKNPDDIITKFDKEYANFRGVKLEENKEYGGKRWHDDIGEIIANDCRIWMKIETEFWPHNINYPDQFVFDYWNLLKEKYEYKN